MNVHRNGLEIAIIGLSGQFPGSPTLDQFWQNLKAGVESISVFSDADSQLASAPSSATQTAVKAGGILTDIEYFDAPFFGINPREAETMDPQHRLFLECAWQALEQAGYAPGRGNDAVGVFAGVGMGTYLLYNLSPHPEVMASRGFLQTLVGVDKDYLSTRVSYKLNLRGPSISVGTACSSSLVAVHLACQSLLSGECDMAIAAGVAVKVPQMNLTLSPDEIASTDGQCHAFDARANGTVGGNGLGAVVLKRLEDAITDRDTIYAVIKGSAINNDGGMKAGYTAPSQAGQTQVIRAAQAMAEVEPDSITYMEAHGTGTPLGDPIEIAAMTEAFRASTNKVGYCAVGSVKTNVGHLDAAAGIAGLIKTTLALHHRLLPASLNFDTPNPDIDFANSPFYINTGLKEWVANGTPRRAGLSSFGFGGTNVHLVLEEAPAPAPSSLSRPQQLLLLSAKTRSALDTATANLVQHLHLPDINLADVAYTLQVGRSTFAHRRIVVCATGAEAIAALVDKADCQAPQSEYGLTDSDTSQRPVVFMFTGQGAQYVNMARELYDTEPLFRQTCDRCFTILEPHLGFDLRSVLYPDAASPEFDIDQATQQLRQTAIAQPALFVIEYALAQLWMSWGIRPTAMIGHSIGEYVAACLAGVFSLEEALPLVVRRGQLMQQLPGGAMLSVNLSVDEVASLLDEIDKTISIAASNSPSLTVVSGSNAAIAALEQWLTQQQIGCQPLHTSHAFHSSAMDEIATPFAQAIGQIQLHPPQMPLISNVTGTWMTAAEATDPQYWVHHLRQTVRFAEGIAELLQDSHHLFLEVGPGRTLNTLTRQQATDRAVLSSLHHPKDHASDVAFLLQTLGRLWLAGVTVNWPGFYAHEQRDRLPLPTYPFERQRYWIDPPKTLPSKASLSQAVPLRQNSSQANDLADWFHVPSWQRSSRLSTPIRSSSSANILIFLDQAGVGEVLVERLQQQGHRVATVDIGSEFAQLSDTKFCLNPDQADDYQALFKTLRTQQFSTNAIAHLWSITTAAEMPSGLDPLDATLSRSFYSLLFLAQALGDQPGTDPVHLTVVSNQLQSVIGNERMCPEKATLLGPVGAIAQEYPHLNCCSIDLELDEPLSEATDPDLLESLLAEITAPSDDALIAYRGRHRWVQTMQPIRLEETLADPANLRSGGVYLITGGLGGIGLTMAEYLAQAVQAKLVLIGRSGLPDDTAAADGQDAPVRRKIADLEALGAEVLVTQADVTDLAQMQRAIAEAEAIFGSINGVIHAAGIPGGGIMQRKTRAAAEAVLAPKVKGTRVLEAVLPADLDFLVLCSSLASVIPLPGQVDYAAANAFLDAVAQARTARDQFTTCINWDAWTEVGMAVKAANPSVQDTDQNPDPIAVEHPLFEVCYPHDADQVRYVSRLSLDQHWVLNDHRWGEQGLLPGTAYLEMARAAWANHHQTNPTDGIELRNVYFLTPLLVDAEQEVHTVLTQKDTYVEFQIQSPSGVQISGAQPLEWQTHTVGEIAIPQPAQPRTFDLPALKATCSQPQAGSAAPSLDHLLDGPIQFGDRWRSLKWINRSDTEALALLELPDAFHAELSVHRLHPALLDVATGFLMMQLRQSDTAYLPFSYRRLTMWGTLSAQICSYIQWLNPSDSDSLKFNIVLMDDQGIELIDIEDYTLRRKANDATT
ncbi:type I polyketide synthase [Acaryochloris marina]|uniref:Beta-ketoacyl synthase, putative n=1 Tax=Acaryochloris marina (strain MBIC 11017) TaxID=329726 RepID=A8ZKN1_ACAM1|nr:type I polyketide synthase [Acaryochloris marina]ABW31349.1 beta-ketoacyl synthase, putative [Acaryochloris marina MBIC11017]